MAVLSIPIIFSGKFSICVFDKPTNTILYLSSINGVLYNKSKTTLIVYPAGIKEDTYDLPNTVNKLGVYSFAFSNIKTIDLKNVTYIDDYTFTYSKINNVVISDKVTYLGKGAFLYSNISDITLGHGLTELSTECFKSTELLNEIIIPNTINIRLYDSLAINQLTTAVGQE